MIFQLPANYSLHIYDELDSTNSSIKDDEFLDGSIVLAKRQKCARGKGESTWVSPIGNLYFSLKLNYFTGKHCNAVLHLVFLVAISIKEALGIEEVMFKWPNDLMLKGKKFAGILIETVVNKSIVIGVGLNISSAPIDATTILAYDNNIEQNPVNLLKKIIVFFDKNKKAWLESDCNFNLIKSRWNDSAFKLNETIVFDYGNNQITGVLLGIDETGAILIKNEDGINKFCFGSICIM